MHWAARLIALSLLIGVSLPASANTLTGKVVKITDGDTLYVLDANYKEHKIRLAGIDAPERKQAYGLASRKHLASIVALATVVRSLPPDYLRFPRCLNMGTRSDSLSVLIQIMFNWVRGASYVQLPVVSIDASDRLVCRRGAAGRGSPASAPR